MSLRPRPSILIVESDPSYRRLLVQTLEEAGGVAAEATSLADAESRLEGFPYDGLVVEVRIPGGDGLDLLDTALTRYPALRCVVIDGGGSLHHAVRALKRGARDYFVKPVPAAMVIAAVLGQPAEVPSPRPTVPVEDPREDRKRTSPPQGTSRSFPSILGVSAPMQHLIRTIERVAPMQSGILIQGETGTGKELVARTIHAQSTRSARPFVAFNAAAVPDGLAETELFGHMKGSFTGAVETRVGRFEAADRGTLFIDEVSSMSLALQAKLLRALQEREVDRVGASRPIKVDVRVIAASNNDLAEMVRNGQFREDLYYRLNVIRVTLPPLRARADDIPLLAQHFVNECCRVNNLAPKVLSQVTLQTLMRHSWPGNVRNLQNAIETAVVMSGTDREIAPDTLPEEVLEQAAPVVPIRTAGIVMPATPDEGINFVSAMSHVERELILTYLRKAGGNKRQAARMLKLSRTTLIDKLYRLGVTEREPVAGRVEAVA